MLPFQYTSVTLQQCNIVTGLYTSLLASIYQRNSNNCYTYQAAIYQCMYQCGIVCSNIVATVKTVTVELKQLLVPYLATYVYHMYNYHCHLYCTLYTATCLCYTAAFYIVCLFFLKKFYHRHCIVIVCRMLGHQMISCVYAATQFLPVHCVLPHDILPLTIFALILGKIGPRKLLNLYL